MNLAQQHAPSSKKLCLTALEQALANSKAREIETQKTLNLLRDGFQLLQDLVLKHIHQETARWALAVFECLWLGFKI